MLALIDPWILGFSLITVVVTVIMGFRSARSSKSAADFFVAGRSVSVGWNASAISGEYLSAASFMGVAGMVMSSGYDALWYPVCYACGYLFLLLFIAGPLRRFGAYTIPDFAEGRYDSPVFRKIAVVFVLFIGCFYTMPQMKGAGTTLAYIFKDIEFLGHQGLPYWVGVALVGAIITLNVALGGMKGITLVQAVQYWAKMFAISVPVFVLMSVYGGYGTQVGKNLPSPSNLSEPGDPGRDTGKIGRRDTVKNGSIRLSKPTPIAEISAILDRRLGSFTLPVGFNFEDVFQNPGEAANQVSIAAGMKAKEFSGTQIPLFDAARLYALYSGKKVWIAPSSDGEFPTQPLGPFDSKKFRTRWSGAAALEDLLTKSDYTVIENQAGECLILAPADRAQLLKKTSPAKDEGSRVLPAKAPGNPSWLNPFGPLTTKAAKAAKPTLRFDGPVESTTYNTPVSRFFLATLVLPIGDMFSPTISGFGGQTNLSVQQAALHYANCYQPIRVEVSRSILTNTVDVSSIRPARIRQFRQQIAALLESNGIVVQHEGGVVRMFPRKEAVVVPLDAKPYALLYTYSLIIALVCGTAGLPHILVRFYTNPDGVAAKRTTMWVMILIGVFYVFPPVFGVLGRNLMPALYDGVGVNGTDGIVLKLPTLLSQKYGILGSILSGITCAGAFAAFMSTFSGLLVSMTGALAHDVYGRILRPQSTPAERMRMFKFCAIAVGTVAVFLGTLVENFEINFMVGQAFAIAAASYFPLLFMSVWWRGMTTRGAATGMLTGGLLAVAAISLTSWTTFITTQSAKFKSLGVAEPGWFASIKPYSLTDYWAEHPLLRILCEQPAIWAVPTAIGLMVVVSKLTSASIPKDIRMKMLVLHAPEALGLKQEYIRDHEAGH